MKYLSFGSKANPKAFFTQNPSQIPHSKTHVYPSKMQESIQEFLQETKSIEEDLLKLKQLSVEKQRMREGRFDEIR
jgi:hypothetical protein